MPWVYFEYVFVWGWLWACQGVENTVLHTWLRAKTATFTNRIPRPLNTGTRPPAASVPIPPRKHTYTHTQTHTWPGPTSIDKTQHVWCDTPSLLEEVHMTAEGYAAPVGAWQGSVGANSQPTGQHTRSRCKKKIAFSSSCVWPANSGTQGGCCGYVHDDPAAGNTWNRSVVGA